MVLGAVCFRHWHSNCFSSCLNLWFSRSLHTNSYVEGLSSPTRTKVPAHRPFHHLIASYSRCAHTSSYTTANHIMASRSNNVQRCARCHQSFESSRSLQRHLVQCAKSHTKIALRHYSQYQISHTSSRRHTKEQSTSQLAVGNMLQQQNIASSMTGAALVTMKNTQEVHSQTYRENVDRIGNGITGVGARSRANEDMEDDDDDRETSSYNIETHDGGGDSEDFEPAGGGGGDEWSSNSSGGELDDEDRMHSDTNNHTIDLSAAEYVCFNDIFGGDNHVDGEDSRNGGAEGHSTNIQPPRTEDEDNRIVFHTEGVAVSTAAGVHLMNILHKHNCDAGLYNDIVEYLIHQKSLGYNFQNPLPKKDLLMSKCTSLFNLHGLQPTMKKVPVESCASPFVHVPVFDLPSVLSKLLQNPELMQQSNFAKGLDIFTGKPNAVGQAEQGAYIDEIHTGSAWEPARQRYCGDDDHYFPCGLIVFYDKSHFDRHGALALAPFMITCTLFNVSARANRNTWAVWGYVPNLRLGTSADNAATPSVKLQDEHACIAAILSQLEEILQQGGIPMKILGRDVVVRPWIHMVVGDIEGMNQALGHYNNSGNKRVKRPYRDCKCSFLDLGLSSPDCDYITRAEVLAAKQEGDDAIRQLSKHPINNAFDNKNVPLACTQYGIYKMTPPEVLHTLDSGLIEYALVIFANMFDGNKVARNNLHLIHLSLCKYAKLQSEQDFPRPSTRNGITETTKQQASEHVGNFFMILCLSHTKLGADIIKPCLPPSTSLARFQKCIQRILAIRQWLLSPHSKPVTELPAVQAIIATAIDELKHCFPRTTGNEWNMPKVHGFTKFIEYIKRFGLARNFFGGDGESFLKDFLKKPAGNTQKRPTVFATQLAHVLHDRVVIQHAYDCLQQQLMLDYEQIQNKTTSDNMKGVHVATFGKRNTQGHYTRGLDWSDRSKMVMDIRSNGRKSVQAGSASVPIDDVFWHAINAWTMSKGYYDELKTQGYTCVRLQTKDATIDGQSSIFRVSESYRGERRNDWCMILSHSDAIAAEDDFDCWEHMCPARLHGVFHFLTPGTPTPKLCRQHTMAEIRQHRMQDPTLYVVVHAAQRYVTWRQLESEFVIDFKLGDINDTVYILPIERVIDPAFVYHKLGGQMNEFFCVLPKRYWEFHLQYSPGRDDNESEEITNAGISHKNVMH